MPCRSSTSIRMSSRTDNMRYPLQPLGGIAITWSRDRPTTYEMMVKAMDEAGVAKSAIVQASTAYGHDNSYVAEAIAAHPKRFTGVFSVDMLAPDDVEKMRHWLGRGFSRHAAVHHRQHHAGAGDLVRRPAHVSGLGARQRRRHPGLHADDAAGLSATARAARTLPEGADHPRPPGAAGADRWPAVHRRQGFFRAGAHIATSSSS